MRTDAAEKAADDDDGTGLAWPWLRVLNGLWRRRGCSDAGLRRLQKRLDYGFRDRQLLVTALTHASSRDDSGNGDSDNQRLEFLGDAVLGFLVAAEIYRRHQGHREGVLTCIRSRVTNGRVLGRIAADIGLGDFLRMARGEERMGGRKRSSTLADALESIFGAAYQDGGLPATERIFRRLIVPALDETGHDLWTDNPKDKLQCITQRLLREDPSYRVSGQSGSCHQPVFTVEVLVRGNVVGVGTGVNKRRAQFAAARMAIDKLAQSENLETETEIQV